MMCPETKAGRRILRWFDSKATDDRMIYAVAKNGPTLGDLRAAIIDIEHQAVQPRGPRIVCLCGSTRFYEAFQEANYDETMAGRIVLSVGFYPHAKAKHGHGEGVGHDSSEKVALDELHKRKIDLADEVLVLNVGGYIGESTRSEIDYAIAHGKPIRYAESASEVEPTKREER